MWDVDVAEKPRLPLSRERVLRGALGLADERGLDALTMRSLGQELGVEAMSLYNHVDNKEAVLDGLVELVVGEIVDAVEDEPLLRARPSGRRSRAGGSSPPAR